MNAEQHAELVGALRTARESLDRALRILTAPDNAETRPRANHPCPHGCDIAYYTADDLQAHIEDRHRPARPATEAP